jgi:hypothetical protein
MNPDPASLDNLQDIYVPPDVPWWPPAPGWWVLLAVVVSAVGLVVWRAWHKWRRGAYRRAGLRELQRARTGAEIAEVLKRTALCAYPRDQIASLAGEAWCQWLASKGGPPLTAAVRQWLSCGVYSAAETESLQEVTDFTAGWIAGHQTMDNWPSQATASGGENPQGSATSRPH